MKTAHEQLLKMLKDWENITGIIVIENSIVYAPETGVSFLTDVKTNKKILDYYAMQGREQYKKVQKIKQLRYYKTVVREAYFNVSYGKGYYYTSDTSKTARSEKHQQIAEEMKEMVLYAAKQIALDIYKFLSTLNISTEKDTHLIDIFNYE